MPFDPDVLSVSATTHGRVLVRQAPAPRGLLFGFHGYLENAAIQLERIDGMPGAERWTRVAVQALHRVYRGRTPEVVASWMTSQDRDEMIADNIAYVEAVVRAIAPRAGVAVVHAGFSQGAAMAFRAAVHGGAAGIISVGGDVPPDVLAGRDVIPPVFLARGDKDDWYSGAQHERDAEALRARGVSVEPFVYAGGHAWTADVSVAAAAWLESIAAAP